MACRKNIYLTDDAEKLIGATPEGLTARLNTIVTRYKKILEAECPELDLKEWIHIYMSVERGAHLNTKLSGRDLIDNMWALVDDLGGLPIGTVNALQAEESDLALRIKRMSYVRRCAIVEVIENYRSMIKSEVVGSEEETEDDKYRFDLATLQASGAKIKDFNCKQ